MSSAPQTQSSSSAPRSYRVIDDIENGAGKTALVRVDLNVPVAKDGTVSDTTRIDRIKPTLEALQDKGLKIVLLSHFGRPKGQKNMDYSLAFLAPFMSAHLGLRIDFCEDCKGSAAKNAISTMHMGDILLLENTRFYPEEEQNDADFAKELANLGDIFINDAFSAAHRAHASTEGIAHHLPSFAGLLMDTEISAISSALEYPEHPVAAIVGGAKISTKLDLLRNLIEKVDALILGGGMANTFMASRGADMKASLYEADMLETARAISQKAENIGCQIILPVDVVCATEFRAHAPHQVCASDNIAEGHMALDIGTISCTQIENVLNQCKTIVWNGPLGAFEIAPFDHATNRIAGYVAFATKSKKLKSIAGGGDTVAALNHTGCADSFSYLSSAGGAFLEWLEGKELPGVKALDI